MINVINHLPSDLVGGNNKIPDLPWTVFTRSCCKPSRQYFKSQEQPWNTIPGLKKSTQNPKITLLTYFYSQWSPGFGLPPFFPCRQGGRTQVLEVRSMMTLDGFGSLDGPLITKESWFNIFQSHAVLKSSCDMHHEVSFGAGIKWGQLPSPGSRSQQQPQTLQRTTHFPKRHLPFKLSQTTEQPSTWDILSLLSPPSSPLRWPPSPLEQFFPACPS